MNKRSGKSESNNLRILPHFKDKNMRTLHQSTKKCLLVFYLTIAVILPAVGQEEAQPYFTVGEMPDLLRILPPPPDTTSASFALDIVWYMWGKKQRMDTTRSAIAIADAEFSLNNLIRVFSEPFGITISSEETPELYRLLRDFTVTCDYISLKTKNYYMRIRPFMLFHEHTLTPEYEEIMAKNGSYPSGHTVFGWCAALILSEINPEQTEALMARGYMFGESRVIVGAHWQSDVNAGMLTASILNAKLHTSPIFLDRMAKAKTEFVEKKYGTSNTSELIGVPTSQDNYIYNISGHQLAKEPTHGVYIQSGKKILYRNRQ